MTNPSTKHVAKMSDMVLQCEERSVWNDAEVYLRHGNPIPVRIGDYAAALTREMNRRGVASIRGAK